MLDLRRPPAPLRAARLALAALLTICCAWAIAPSAHAATGELLAFGEFGFNNDQFAIAGPVALDATDGNSFYVADLNDSFQPRLRKFSSSGTLLATVAPPMDNPGGRMYIVGLALDTAKDRLYVLVDSDEDGPGLAREILAYSTTPQSGALVAPADLPSGVLIDFREPAGGSVDDAVGLAVDPGTNRVAVLGVDDSAASDPQGVLQYVTDAGALVTPRVAGLGAGLDPDGTTVGNPAGLAIAPDGTVYVASTVPNPASDGTSPGRIYRLPRESGDSVLFATDTNSAQFTPGFVPYPGFGGLGVGSPISVSTDGATVYVAEGSGAGGRARGYSTATTPGTPRVVYGGGSTSCVIYNQGLAFGLSAGAGDDLAAVSLNTQGLAGTAVNLFGTGGTGCPRTQGAFTVNTLGGGAPITVTKGQSVAFDASASDLLSSAPTQVDWDFDGSGDFASHVTGAPASLKTTHKFLQLGTFTVGVRIHTDGTPTTDAVFHQVKVVAPIPSASFRVSSRTPAAGASVTFDAGDSVDPAGSATGGPSHDLAKYRWDFGDGQTQETTTATTTHAFANGGTAALSRTVKLTVVSHDDVVSGAVTQTLTVAGTPATEQPPGPQPPGQQPPQQQPPAQKPPVVTPPSPGLASPTVDGKGATVTMKVTCPAGGAACTGKVTLTVKVKQKVKGRTRTVTVTIGTASFDVAAGKSGPVKVKLSAKGKGLLKKQKRLSATAAVSVTAGGKTSTKSKTLSLKAPAKRK